MNRVAEFLTARIGEDEAAASAVHGWWRAHGERAIADVSYAAVLIADVDPATRAHILRYDPARALREVEAKRARLALFGRALTEMDRLLADDDADKGAQGAAIGCCEAARSGVELDAAVYSDHPDYRKERDR